MGRKVADLINQKFGRLSVVGRAKNVKKRPAWLCICDCGNLKTVTSDNLRSGSTKSCGCYKIDQLIKRSSTHGKSKLPIYKAWHAMVYRCTDRKSSSWENYGARGISVCDEWMDFNAFYLDMSETYRDGLSIERINNNGNYCLNNCKWADILEQSNNRRDNILIDTPCGVMTVSQAARKYKIHYNALYYRMTKGYSGYDLIARSRADRE